jgi:hypothetical protein
MRLAMRVVIAAALAFGSGCAQKDWIDRTLVTVDVTGTWYGRFGEAVSREMVLELKQEGSTVKGSLRQITMTSQGGDMSGPIEGTVAGDVFRFSSARGRLEGELTVSGDEMNGRVSITSSVPISLRRVDASPRPASPPR